MKRHGFRPNHDALDCRAIPGAPWGPAWIVEAAGALESAHLLPIPRKPPADRVSHPLTITRIPDPAVGISPFTPVPSPYTSSASPSTPTVASGNHTPTIGFGPPLHLLLRHVHHRSHKLLA